jgi:leucyl-tRNA synthetase
MQYNFNEIEKKWQAYWNENNSYKVENDFSKPKCYVLDMFPYPSGAGLHVGHPLGYIASDIYARYKRLKGFNVLHPMGFDAFGLPAEQYAIETGQHPATTTKVNIERYKEQLGKIGFCYDWSREVKTADPNYYKWTQWIFLQLYNSWYNPKTNKVEKIETIFDAGCPMSDVRNTEPNNQTSNIEHRLMEYRLAYKKESYVNWCEVLGTVLANDEVVNGVSERGGHLVERKLMSQWFLRITAFAERLLTSLDDLDFPESLKEMQRNWIGKSVGAEIKFDVRCQMPDVSNTDKTDNQHLTSGINVFTTRPDTIFGVSFIVLAPEHELVNLITTAEQKKVVEEYQKFTSSRSERERLAETKTISGSFTGAYAIHPFTGKEIPIWISEYVLAGYGTGAIMAVPCGDDRDYAFAKHFNLEIPNIFKGVDISEKACSDKNAMIANSDFISDLSVKEASKIAIDKIEALQIGTRKINYRMRDAGFSRQRYWGEPFPIVYDENGTAIALNDKDLPLELPFLETYSAGPNGKGPLANATDWMNTTHPLPLSRGESVTRETDTMPGYAGSSWYYLRYMDPHNSETFCDKKISDYWNQVDVYIGGAEHAVGHLLYSRMWCKTLHDLGFISYDEPYKKLINQGMIGGSSRFVYRIKNTNQFVSKGLKENYDTNEIHVDVTIVDGYELNLEAFKKIKNNEYANAAFILEDGKYICGEAFEKMSKSKYNVVNPDDIILQYGADTFRMYEMFLGPLEMSKPWDTKGIEGVHRFLKKFWRLFVNDISSNLEEGLSEISSIVTNEAATKEELKTLHKHIKKIQHDIENFAFNTSVSQFMIITNELSTLNCHKREILEPILITLVSFAPHIAEELWSVIGNKTSILDAQFPTLDENFLVENTFHYPVAILGKSRTEMEFALDATQDDIQMQVLANEIVQKWMDGKPLKKFIFVKGKMINVVV